MENQTTKIQNLKKNTRLSQPRVPSSNYQKLIANIPQDTPKSRQNSILRKLNDSSKIQKLSTLTKVPEKISKPLPNHRKNLDCKKDLKVGKNRSKSPTCLKRNTSEDLSKNFIMREKSLDALNISAKSSKAEQLSENIIKLSSKFTVQKIADLKNLDHSGNEDLVKTLIFLLREVDYHLQDSKNIYPDIFLEYIKSPGIVVQNLKKLSYYIAKCRVPEKTYSKAFEIYNNIESVSNTAGHTLLVSFLESVFRSKNFSPKIIKFLNSQEIEMVQLEKSSPGPAALLKSESSLKTDTKKSDFFSGPESPKPEISFDQINSFKESKQFLLDRFFSKMINQRSEESSQITRPIPLADLSNLIKQDSQKPPSPAGLKSGRKADQEEKLKNSAVPAGLLKKIEEKFISLLQDKMKRDPKDLIKLKINDFEEYSVEKNKHISKNKEQWVKEILSLILETEFESSENDPLQGFKQSVLKDYLSQEKVLNSIISRAEYSELLYRKL